MRRWQIARERTPAGRAVAATVPETDEAPNIFRREGEFWCMAYGGKSSFLKHRKGFACIAHLLRQSGVDIHVMTLVATIEGMNASVAPSAQEDLKPGRGGDAGEVLDSQAIEEYKREAQDLRQEIDEAEANNDHERVARAKETLDAVTAQLEEAIGLGGRKRKAGSNEERARSNVTKLIGQALVAIERDNKDLAGVLRASIRTGTVCSYTPITPITWNF
jgi:hypothetical protein